MRIYMIAGESSGDTHGAVLMREIARLVPGTQFFGAGGPQMKKIAQGQFIDWTLEAVVGLWDVMVKYPYFREKFYQMYREIREVDPDAVIFVDYPGFNLRLAYYLRRKQFSGKLIYYISPQVWAWNRGRIPRMAAFLDLMICIFPFEKALYEASGLKTEFVGHPMIEELDRQRIHEPRVPNLVALLPGSRSREIKRIFPVMLEAAKLLRTKDEALRFEASAASESALRIHAETGGRFRLRRDPDWVKTFLRADAASVGGDGCFRHSDVGIQFLSFAICFNLQGGLADLLSRAFAHPGRPFGDA